MVVVGGGIVGCSVAYHLARRGVRDLVVLDQGLLAGGSTWHAAGLIGQLRSSAGLTRLLRKSVDVYGAVEAETGLPTGWRRVGSLRVAASPERWLEVRRLVTAGRAIGFDAELVSVREAAELFPLLSTDGLEGAAFVATDGYADPSQLTQALAAGARAYGVSIVQHARVERVWVEGRRVVGVSGSFGTIACEVLVNATGMWGRDTGALAGVAVPVTAVEHQYIATERREDIPDDLPTLRDPDARVYLKPDSGGLVLGGWEDGTQAPWRRVPPEAVGTLFPPDEERFAPLAEAAALRVPVLEELGIRAWVNGPIPFTPDAEPLIGPTEDLDNLFHCCGFSAGIAAAGGAGWALANWVVDGDPGLDLGDLDPCRFDRHDAVPAYLATRAVDAYEGYYALASSSARRSPPAGARRSPLHEQLVGRGAVMTYRDGWARPARYSPTVAEQRTAARAGEKAPSAHSLAAEVTALLEGAALVDVTSSARYELFGPGALEALQRVSAADVDLPVGFGVATLLLNRRGGIEAEATVVRIGPDRLRLLAPSTCGRRAVRLVLREGAGTGEVAVVDLSSCEAALAVLGPKSDEVWERVVDACLDEEVSATQAAREVGLGDTWGLVVRTAAAGASGWQAYVPTDQVAALYERLLAAGADLGIADVGFDALEGCRLVRHEPAFAHELGPEVTPLEAGIGHVVALDKPALAAGPALRALIATGGPHRRLRWLRVRPGPVLSGGERVLHDPSGWSAPVTSAGPDPFGEGGLLATYVPTELDDERLFSVEVAGETVAALAEEAPTRG